MNEEIIENIEGDKINIDKRIANLIPAKKGEIRNPWGRTKLTTVQKAINKATKQFIEEYKRSLAESLPKLSPILISLAMEGDIMSIKEINDRVMGKSVSPVDITSGGEAFIRPNEEQRERALRALDQLK